MKNITRISIVLMLLAGGVARGQQRLTLQDAITRTLKHNYDISIAGLTAEQAARNNTLGNAGFLPGVNLNGTVSSSRTNVLSQLVNGTEQNNPRAKSFSYNPSVTVSWTLFDGFRMFIVKKQLDKLEALSEVQLLAQVQSTVSRTIQMYAQVVWRKRQVVAIDTALALARVRILITGVKYETGAGAKIDLLQAKVDLNARRADSLTYTATLNQASDSLAVLMGETPGDTYVVDDSLHLNAGITPIDKARLEAINLSLSAYRYNAEVSHLNADIAKTSFLPTLNFDGGLTYLKSTTATGFALSNRTYGGNGVLTLSMPLYQGGNIRRQAKVASLQAMKDDLLYERQSTIVGRQYRTAWKNYDVAIASYNLERENILIAKENVDVQHARFRVGIGTTLESREAENDYVTALVRLYTAEYNLKVNETIVLELQNQLVTEER
ncbi:MAG: TolC family protein [Bacteroidota bacterium]